MTLSFCSISALDRPIEEVAKLAAAAGLDGLEVTAHRPHLDPDRGIDAARKVGRQVRDAGIDVTAYGSYLGRYGRTTPEHAKHDAAIAAALETKLFRVWAEPLEEGQEDIAPCVELMRTACDAVRSRGITVVIERHVGSFADTPDRIARLLDAIDRPNAALNYQVLDFLPPSAADKQTDDVRALIGHAKYFHLKNYVLNTDEGGPLLPGGSLEGGVLDYRAILRAALEAGYDGPMTIEFLAADERPLEDKLRADVHYVRHIVEEQT